MYEKLTELKGHVGAEVMSFLNPKAIKDNFNMITLICDNHILCVCSTNNTNIICNWHYLLSNFHLKFMDFSIVDNMLIATFTRI